MATLTREQALQNLQTGGMTGAALKAATDVLNQHYDSLAKTSAPDAPMSPIGQPNDGAAGNIVPVEHLPEVRANLGLPPEPRADSVSAPQILKRYGLTGLIKDSDLYGLTLSEAATKAQQIRDQKLSSTSTNNSAIYDPATVSGAKKTLATFNTKLQDTNNDPWTSKGTKQDKVNGLYESTANQYANLFSSVSDFDSLLNSNPDFQASINAFKQAGGDVNAIRTRITTNATASPTLNQPAQSTQDYLAKLPVQAPANATPAERDAFNSLIPERQLAQDQIIRDAKIPQQYKDLYFGTPDTLGILQEKRIQAEQQKAIIQKKEASDLTTVQARADLAIQKNNAEMDIQEAQIEENRLAARNYATGMLAKLGALNTTGAAPLKLTVIEQKYQQQSDQLKTRVRLANESTAIDLRDNISKIQTQADSDILDLQTNLTKDKETVFKEAQKIQQDSDAKIYTITDKAANELRTQTEKFKKEATALAQKNAKAYAKTVAAYSPTGIKNLTTKQKAAALDADIQDAVKQLQTIVKAKGFYGVSQDDYDTFAQAIQDQYGTAGVGKFRTELGHVGLAIDKVGDNKGGI